MNVPDAQLTHVFALVGLTSGLIVSGLYLVLAPHASRRIGSARSLIALGVCALSWSMAALWSGVNVVLGQAPHSTTVVLALGFRAIAIGAWIAAGLTIWQTYADTALHLWTNRILRFVAFAVGAAIGLLSFAVVLNESIRFLLPWLFAGMRWYVIASGSVLSIYSLILLHRTRSSPRPVWFSTALMSVGCVTLTAAALIRVALPTHPEVQDIALVVVKQAPLGIILGSLFLFARFRNADLFIRYSMRVVLAAGIACLILGVLRATVVHSANSRGSEASLTLFVSCLLIACAVVLFWWCDLRIRQFVDNWVFRGPDCEKALSDLQERIEALPTESELARAVQDSVQRVLEIERVDLVPIESLPRVDLDRLALGDVVEIAAAEYEPGAGPGNATLVIPVQRNGQLVQALLVVPARDRRVLVSREIAFLRSTGVRLGLRLSALQRQREQVERQNREAHLLHQVTEAELRALRAQLNPHFLFNALNTVADLVVTDPARAETMTLRLAQVFRHVLTHSSRTVTSLEDEIGFVRKYLSIEEARFGERLVVDISISAEVSQHRIPSLILQPLVENALKHGLGPKTGVGHLWIRATKRRDHVCLTVEDDGVGFQPRSSSMCSTPEGRSAGVGLRNIAERLAGIYAERASFLLEPREPAGSRATLLVPVDLEFSP